MKEIKISEGSIFQINITVKGNRVIMAQDNGEKCVLDFDAINNLIDALKEIQNGFR